MCKVTLTLFSVFLLQQVALENGLILVDTKYEFGKSSAYNAVRLRCALLLLAGIVSRSSEHLLFKAPCSCDSN